MPERQPAVFIGSDNLWVVEPDGMGMVPLGEQHFLVQCLIRMLEKNL